MGNYPRLWYWCGYLLISLIVACNSESTTGVTITRDTVFIPIPSDSTCTHHHGHHGHHKKNKHHHCDDHHLGIDVVTDGIR